MHPLGLWTNGTFTTSRNSPRILDLCNLANPLLFKVLLPNSFYPTHTRYL